jgi:excinuclease ABC subunit B
MQKTINETNRRRLIQLEYNKKNKITPKSIVKSITNILDSVYERDYVSIPTISEEKEEYLSKKDIKEQIKKLKDEMLEAAKNLEFEKAAELRDRMFELEQLELEFK